MLIFDAESSPIIIDSIYTPITTDYFWVLDLNQMDYMLTPLTVLGEVVCPTLEVMVKGFKFCLPADWNILVYDRDTSQLDVIQLAEAAGKEFTALVYGPSKLSPSPAPISITNYMLEYKNVRPILNKHQMLCHPIGPDEWITVSSSDTYNKYLKDKVVGDLMGY